MCVCHDSKGVEGRGQKMQRHGQRSGVELSLRINCLKDVSMSHGVTKVYHYNKHNFGSGRSTTTIIYKLGALSCVSPWVRCLQ